MVNGIISGITGGATVAIVIKAVDRFSKTFNKAQVQMKAIGAGLVAAGAIIGAGLNKAVQTSSNLAESINAVNVVFKKFGTQSLKTVQDFGKTAAKEVGLSNKEFNELAVRFSNFANIVTAEGGDVGDTVIDITKRAADFASVMNIDVAEAARLFQSGLAGETEPLRRYGIDVSAAAVKTFAYASGIAKAGQELTEAQKIQARYELILNQTNDTANDFKNTSDGLANSTRILNAETENAAAAIGTGLQPAYEAVLSVVRPLVTWFNSLSDSTKGIIGIILAVTAVVFVLGGAFLFLAAAGAAANIALGPFILIILAIIAVIAAVILIFLNWKKILMTWFKLQQQLAIESRITWEKYKDTWAVIWATIKNAFIKAWNAMINATFKAVNLIIDGIEPLIEAFNKLSSKFGGPTIDLGSIRKAATALQQGALGDVTDIEGLKKRQLGERNLLRAQLEAESATTLDLIAQKIGFEAKEPKTEVNINGDILGLDAQTVDETLSSALGERQSI